MDDESTEPIRIAYGAAPQQFGDLTVPSQTDAAPVVVLIHGGFWRNRFELDLMAPLAADLVERGYAVWNIEYRRLGDAGGGWPGTFDDVAAAVDALATLSDDHLLDLDRLSVVGHSAGGQLALWVAGRADLPPDAPGANPTVVPAGAIGQGAVVDLAAAARDGLGGGAVVELLGGTPVDVPDRYDLATPRVDAGPAVFSVVGSADGIVPPTYSFVPEAVGGVAVVDGADHFDLIDPSHAAWAAVVEQLAR